VLNDTMVLLAADHGERLGEGGVWDHCYSLHDLELRVPLALRLPNRSEPLELEPVASTLDLFPTLLDALDVSGPGSLDGRTLLGPRSGATTRSTFDSRVAVADESWKLVLACSRSGCTPETLVRVEPSSGAGAQMVPLAEEPDAVARLSADVTDLETRIMRALDDTEREFEALRSIGYVR
jgi:arylsulfatase A-like enzyme